MSAGELLLGLIGGSILVLLITALFLAAPVYLPRSGGHTRCPACGGRCSGTPDHRCNDCGASVCPPDLP